MKAVIGERCVRLDGRPCFVDGARRVTLGAWGSRTRSAHGGGGDGIAIHGALPPSRLATLRVTVTLLDVHFADERGIDLLAAVLVPGLGSGKVGLQRGDFLTGDVCLLWVAIETGCNLIEAINTSPGTTDGLWAAGVDACVVTGLLMAMHSTLARRMVAARGVTEAAVLDGLMMRADAIASGDKGTVIGIAPGMAVGYRLARLRWNARPVGVRPGLDDLVDDSELD